MNPETTDFQPDVERELVIACEDPQQFKGLLDKVPFDKLPAVQNYLWNYLVNLARENGRPLERHEIAGRMITNLDYQRRTGCRESEETCRAKICQITNPNCASDKIKMHINTLREMILEYKNPQEER